MNASTNGANKLDNPEVTDLTNLPIFDSSPPILNKDFIESIAVSKILVRPDNFSDLQI